ncbi:MAG TPA: cytochrome c biogenesis protein CcsA [Polyangiaceae bacterium]|nr:cytochrome c biogenesis protein CcsA [Polyangiaceae bacterium]
MPELAPIAFYLGVVAYSAASTVFFLELVRSEPQKEPGVFGPRLLLLGALIHAVHVVAASLLSHVCPVESLQFGLSLTALGAVVAYLLLRRRFRLHAVGAIVGPLALTFLIGAQFVSAPRLESDVPRGLLAFHIAANLLGLGVFLVAGGSSALYVLLERRLRHKKSALSSGSSRLPPLDALDRAAHRLLLIGFPLLTFGVVTGAVFTQQVAEAGSAAILRTALGYATWGLLAAVLLLRQLIGLRGRRAAYGTLAGVACVLLVMLVYAVRGGAA